MSEDLVKTLRAAAARAMNQLHCGSENWEYRQAHKLADPYRDAANTIEAQASRIAELERERDEALTKLTVAEQVGMHLSNSLINAREDVADAREKALEEAAAMLDAHFLDGSAALVRALASKEGGRE